MLTSSWLEMIYLSTAVLLIIGYVAAQNPDPNCNYYQRIAPFERYFIDRRVGPNERCRYILNCTSGYNCRADCNIAFPFSNGCTRDRVLMSQSGDPTLAAAEAYCGTRSLSVVSNGNLLSFGVITVQGGTLKCNLTAQPVPPTTAPPPDQCTCGVANQDRVVGGVETSMNEFPMMAGLLEVSTRSIHCGTVLISDRHLLIVAHCVYNETSKGPQRTDIYVVLTETYNIETGPSKSNTIGQFIIHENYNPVTNDNDIAIIITQHVIQLNMRAIPVCLPFNLTNNEPPAGTNCTALGWGLKSPGGMLADTLRSVVLPTISRQECSRTEQSITNRQICTYARGKDTCQYDSGGPLLVDDDKGNLVCYGLTIYGASCASATRPGVFTNVVAYLQWILRNAVAQFCIKR